MIIHAENEISSASVNVTSPPEAKLANHPAITEIHRQKNAAIAPNTSESCSGDSSLFFARDAAKRGQRVKPAALTSAKIGVYICEARLY